MISIGSDLSEFAIVLRNLSFAYPERPNLLQDIHLTLLPGERVGVIGPNGAGKTSLFLVICGVLKPTSGTIVLFDQPIVPGDFRPDLGFVFQNPDDQLFCATVWDEVAFGVQNMGVCLAELTSRVNSALKFTGIEALWDCAPHHLSGGEKRMVAIASILAMHPRLVIYDEPSANLDIRARRRLIQLLHASRETMLVSSHDLELIREVCDRVLLLDQGQIIADGKTDEVMSDRTLMDEHGLEVPHSLRNFRLIVSEKTKLEIV